MVASPEERAARYRNYAAFLRQLAGRTRVETAGAQLRHLAVEFDRLAVSVQHATLAAYALIPRFRCSKGYGCDATCLCDGRGRAMVSDWASPFGKSLARQRVPV